MLSYNEMCGWLKLNLNLTTGRAYVKGFQNPPLTEHGNGLVKK